MMISQLPLMKSIQLCLILCFASSHTVRGAEPSGESKLARFDVLVFAPHPDDEVLGCAGVIMQAPKENKRVGVVVLTNGGGFPRAASVITGKPREELKASDFLKLAATRQQQSVAGLKHLNLPKSNLMFLGYPDSLLAEIYRSERRGPLRQAFTEKNHTYSMVGVDLHSWIHGCPAPYTKASILGDIVEIIDTHKPIEIYVTHEVDQHRDHKAAFWFVRDAAREAGYRGKLLTYVVHGKEQPNLPVSRVPLTTAQVKTKRAAIREHQIPTVHDHLGSHAREQEVFWLTPVESLNEKTP